MLMEFRRWSGRDQGHYYSVSVPLGVILLLGGGLLALMLPLSRWLF